MKKRFLVLISVLLAQVVLSVGFTTVFAAPNSEQLSNVSVVYNDGEFSATNGYTVATSGVITPAQGLQNGYHFASDAYYTVTAPADVAFTDGAGLSLAFTYKSSSNTQGAENNGTEKNEQLFSVTDDAGREAYICMGGLYYRSAKGKTLQAATKEAKDGYKAITTAAKEIVIYITEGGIYFYANGQELYSFTATSGVNTAKIFLETLSTPGSTLGVHKGSSSKTDLMTNTVNLANLTIYGKQLSEDEISALWIERVKNTAKSKNLEEKFSITYENDLFTSSNSDYVAIVEGEGVITDPDNSRAFKFVDGTSHVKIAATNGAVLSSDGTMTIAFKQRVSSVDDSGYLENLLSAVNEKGENANVLLGEMDIYRYLDGETKLTRTAIVRSAHQQLLKKVKEHLVMITIAPEAIHVYVNGVQAQQYFGAYSDEVGEYMRFATDTFAAQLTAENGEIILRNERSSSASWNKKVLCLSDVVFFDRELDASEALAYFATTVAPVNVKALENDEYLAFSQGEGIVMNKEAVAPNSFVFADNASYLELIAKEGHALTSENKGVSIHLKQKSLDAASAKADEALASVESEGASAYINLGGISYNDGSSVTSIAASNPSALLTAEWKIVSVVVNKESSSIQVYVNGELVENYTSDGEDSVVAKVVALFSSEASKQGGVINFRKSADQANNTSTLAVTNLTVDEGGLSEFDIIEFVDSLVGIVEIPVEANVEVTINNLIGEVGEAIPVPTEELAGYKFVGYYLDADFAMPVVSGATFTSVIKKLYAKYDLITYKIIYHCNGGVQVEENVDSYDIYSSVTFYDIEKAGYTFEGWYRTENFRNEIPMILAGTTGNVDLYAKFSLNVYSITYELNGGIMTEDNAADSYTVEDTVTIIEAWKPHYTFEGWYADADFATKIESFDVSLAANVTLYAKYSPVSYTLDFVTNGGVLPENANTSYTVEDKFDLPAAEKEHYQFAGWYLEEALETKIYYLRELQGDTTLYAKYTPVKYSITYKIGDSFFNDGVVKEYTVEDDAIDLPEITMDGYTFEGWYADADLTVKLENIDTVQGGDVTVYAKLTQSKDDNGNSDLKSCKGSILPVELLSLLALAAVVMVGRKWRNA